MDEMLVFVVVALLLTLCVSLGLMLAGLVMGVGVALGEVAHQNGLQLAKDRTVALMVLGSVMFLGVSVVWASLLQANRPDAVAVRCHNCTEVGCVC